MSDNFDDQGMLYAPKVVKHPEIMDEVRGQYQTIYDVQGGLAGRYDNLDKALKIMAERGWKAISMTATTKSDFIYVLLERSKLQ